MTIEDLALLWRAEIPREHFTDGEIGAEMARVRAETPHARRHLLDHGKVRDEAFRRLLTPWAEATTKLYSCEERLEETEWKAHLREAERARRPPQHEAQWRIFWRADRRRQAHALRDNPPPAGPALDLSAEPMPPEKPSGWAWILSLFTGGASAAIDDSPLET